MKIYETSEEIKRELESDDKNYDNLPYLLVLWNICYQLSLQNQFMRETLARQ